ncbi:hypothetical protein HMN09_00712300 [Mycena chlorophos]|uniref:PH domain-containing protein n=1 Tax=Mycena chlorophos TaxID=658473 RepID=A0A8H6SYJ7_MYCCL|nr:hypothetical protein HMN09_00712300 [Mycena chlorophos]
MKKRRLSFQNIFSKDSSEQPPAPEPVPRTSGGSASRNYKTLPRSFAFAYDAPPLDGLVLPDKDTFMLDDDPFADLSGGPRHVVDAPKDPPTSPLSSPTALPLPPPVPALPKTPPAPVRTVSSQATPAHHRPAFRARPSLPSLSTLAKMNVPVPKVRRGHVGAGLPSEPWDLDPDALLIASPATASPDRSIIPAESVPVLPISPPEAPTTSPTANVTPAEALQGLFLPFHAPAIPIPAPTLVPLASAAATPVSPLVLGPQQSLFTVPLSPVSPSLTPTSAPTSATFLDLSDDSDEDSQSTQQQAPVPAVASIEAQTSITLPESPPNVVRTPVASRSPAVPLLDLRADPILPPKAPETISPRATPPHSLLSSPHPSLAVKPLPVLREIPSPEPPAVPPKDHDPAPASPPDAIHMDLGADIARELELGLGLDFAHSARGGEEVEPALGRNHSKRLSSQGPSRAGSRAVSRRSSRTVLAPTTLPEAEPLENTPEDESVDYFTPRSRAASSASSGSSSHGLDENVARRRMFRKSSLVGDVLHFAPASPVQPSVLDENAPTASEQDQDPATEWRTLSMPVPSGYSSPVAARSPERGYLGEGYSSPFSARSPERQFSSPYSTPSITTDPRSPDSSWSGHEHPEFDFGWRPSRFASSSSNSDSDYGEESFEDFPPAPIVETPASEPSSAYSDEELMMANEPRSPSLGQLAPAFVFPARARLDAFQPGTSADTIRARVSSNASRSELPWNRDSASLEGSHADDHVLQSSDAASDDDVPLARQIPTALAAQQTIRRQAEDEKESRSRQTTLRPAASGFSPLPPVGVVSPTPPRLRTTTLPGSGLQSMAMDSLTQKLQNMVVARDAPSPEGVHQLQPLMPIIPPRVSSVSPPPADERPLRTARSFQRPKTADSAPVTPQPQSVSLRRRNTTHQPPTPKPTALTVPTASADVIPPLPSPMASSPASGHHNSTFSARPISHSAMTRVFVGDLQHFSAVDIGPTTTAREALAVLEEQGTLEGWRGTGGWMLFEVAQDFGMERPIRGFELLADVQAAWNKEKMVNLFLVKLTSWASVLSVANMPSSSPIFAGYVDWEYKRGKWKKRHLRLRENALWMAKRELDTEEICLCPLATFDAYKLIRPLKAPKPFVFAAKSTDNFSYFEDTADYVHIFSCGPAEGEQWLEKLLLARSFVLYHEPNVHRASFIKPVSKAPSRKASASLLSDLYAPSTIRGI